MMRSPAVPPPPGPSAPITAFRGSHRFLSNFYPSVIEVPITLVGDDLRADGRAALETSRVATVEHAYQALKARTARQWIWVAAAPSPGEARRRGRDLTNIRDDWDALRVPIMRELIRVKFADADLAEQLLLTGDRELIEGNDWGDRFWGATAVSAAIPHHGSSTRFIWAKNSDGYYYGENWLGKILMERRSAIRAARAKDGQ